ncbi:response regulator transcription factor [Thiohalobacter sp. IOR34]|uniref:response regulator n=1 Tax=Thiohalobacter sp. IOR34 TaxID=3057176 RepID=UPI0025AFE8EC|nr:response regulator transcription factor [Thiohalobacter sp. IOR34]WJW74306.1 response regulator transcription factor [Thiohalobacter sp. IOR34]
MRLLLVEDDRALVEGLLPELRQAGYAVDLAADGREALYLGENEQYDIVVLDLGLPLMGGLDVLERWRQGGMTAPVLILTARDSWREKVAGLKAGADDYLTKPFYQEELLARLQALLRRSHGRVDNQLRVGDLTLDEEHQRVRTADGRAIELTGTEFRLLRYFMMNAGKLLSKTRLTEHVYEQDFDRDSNLIEVYVRRLREKIGRERIETRRGQGYVFKG